MAIYLIPLAWSLLSGIMAALLFYLSLQKDRNVKMHYAFALLFTIASWSGLEWALWLMGYNMFDMIMLPVVPLDFFFLSWLAFAVWHGERIGQRKIWTGFLVALFAIFIVARLCMNCIAGG